MENRQESRSPRFGLFSVNNQPCVKTSFQLPLQISRPLYKQSSYKSPQRPNSPNQLTSINPYPYQTLVSPKHSSPYINIQNMQHNNYSINGIDYKSKNTNFQMEKIVSELRHALQQALNNQKILGEQLHREKTKNYQLIDIKRRLEEELTRMQFQLDRISNIDQLAKRQIHIKSQAAQNQNVRLSGLVNDLQDQIKRLKKQNRQLTTKYNQTNQQVDHMQRDNATLLDEIQQMHKDLQQVKHQLNGSTQRQKQYKQQHLSNSFTQNAQTLGTIVTTRTKHYQSGHSSLLQPHSYNQSPSRLGGLQSFNKKIVNGLGINHHQQGQIDYQQQNSKLIQDYQRLVVENQSIKKLYHQFYQSPTGYSTQAGHNNRSHKQIHSISQINQEFQQTDQRLYQPNRQHYQNNQVKHNMYNQHNQQNNKYNQHNQHNNQHNQHNQNNNKFVHNEQNEKLRTYQKTQLKTQVDSLKEQVISQLLQKYYSKTLKQSSSTNKNCLILFIKQISKHLQNINQMSVNYLMARDMLKKQLNLKRFPQPIISSEQEHKIEDMLSKVKSKLKLDLANTKDNAVQTQTSILNVNAYFLALFRLLTLLFKNRQAKPTNSIADNTWDKLKHYCLKYIHKIYEQTHKLKGNSNSQQNNPIKYSLKK